MCGTCRYVGGVVSYLGTRPRDVGYIGEESRPIEDFLAVLGL